MRWTTVGVVAVGILSLAAGGGLYYESQMACNGCGDSPSSNDLQIENERAQAVTVNLRVAENGTTVATATETAEPGNETELVDLVPYGDYRLSVAVGDESLETDWPAHGCYFQTIVVENEGIDDPLTVC